MNQQIFAYSENVSEIPFGKFCKKIRKSRKYQF